MTSSAPASAVRPLSQRLLWGGLFFLLFVVLVGGTGFAGDYRAHNGAHDTRHAMGFPCH